MNDHTIRFVYAGFLVVCVVIGFAAAAALRNINAAAATADWVNHTHATIYELDRVVSGVVAGDGAARTYVWTGRPNELAEARGEFNEKDDHLESLKALVRDDAAVAAQIAELATLVAKHEKNSLALAAAREGKDQAELEKLLQTDPGIETLRDIKRLAAKVRAGQFDLLDQRDRAAYRQAQTTRWVVGTCLALDVLLLVGLAWLIRDDLAARRKLAEVLQAANATLEAKVAERTRELVEANAKLTTENLERKWSAQSLEHQLRYNQIIVNATSDIVFVVTKAATITRVNPAVSLRSGWPDAEILGHPLGQHLEGTTQVEATLRAARELHDQPGRLVGRTGSTQPGVFTLLPIRDNDKVVGGVILFRLTPS